MSRNRAIMIKLPPSFIALCEEAEVGPREVLEAFIRDLCDLPGSNGSDERRLASDYFDRCGYVQSAQWRRESGA